MKEIEITKFSDFHDAIFDVKSITANWIFRGHYDPTYELKPEIGRKPFCDFFDPDQDPTFDKNLLDSWLLKGKNFLLEFGSLSNIELLCLRHHGLPTRLLDWTFSPLVAAFFAVREPFDGDSIIYCLNSKQFDLIDSSQSPFKIKRIHIFDSGGIHQRIVSQSGAFTIHNDPRIDMIKQINTTDNVIKLIIKKGYRELLLNELSYYNIHDFTMFPDLDGLSRRLRWQTEKIIEETKRLGYMRP